MSWGFVFQEAIAALKHHRQRTLFTTLSLGWGVACFVILMSYGTGFENALSKSFRAVGQHLVIAFNGQTSAQAGGLRAGRKIRLELKDYEVVKESVPQVEYISPEIMKHGVKASSGKREKEVAVRAVYPEYEVIRNMKIVDGRWLNEDDRQRQNRVAILGSKVAEEVFGGAPAVNEEITLNGIRFTVIGVIRTKLQISNYNRPDNQCVFIPYNTFSLFGDIRYPWFLVWKSPEGVPYVDSVKAVRAKLAELHRYNPNDEKAVEIIPFDKFMSIISGMSLAVKALLGLVGGLTLAIGGVGLANIMLASVIDRTREIGMIKALGGRKGVILKQFLVEASLVVAMGGVIGIALGIVATQFIGSMPFLGPAFKDTSGLGDIELQVSLGAIVVSTVVLLFVGLIAGIVPAMKAAKLDPIEALHYE